MIRALPLILAALLPAPAAAETCAPIERTAGPPVYAILFGYGYRWPIESSWLSWNEPPPHLPLVDEDLASMARFFDALGPRRMRVHGEPDGEPEDRLSPFVVRPPTWRSLLESVAEVVADLDEGPSDVEAQVYVYLAGHGVERAAPVGDKTRLHFFARPDGSAPGYSGYIDSALFAEHVLTPLAARARVHVIADICFAYALLQTRQMRLTQKVRPTYKPRFYERAFGAAFPDVGAQVASRGVTYGDRGVQGGRFSHALRSMAIGPADVDRDGVVTYGEMAWALAYASRGQTHLFDPDVVAPGQNRDAPFVHWRRSPAARTCAWPGLGGHLRDGRDIFATLPGMSRATPIWLAPEHEFTWRAQQFEAANGVRLPRSK